MASTNPISPARSEELFLDAVRDYAIFRIDREGRILTWNRGAQAIKGYSAEEIIGQHISRFYTPEEREAGRPARLLEIAASQGRVEDEGWRVRKDGTRFWADVVISAQRDSDGHVIGFVKVTRDLTAKKKAEEDLRRSEERLRLMIDTVEDYAIFLLDPEGKVASWNGGARRLSGWTAAEILGRSLSVMYPGDNAEEQAGAELQEAKEHGRFLEEGWRLRKDGSRFWASVVLSAVRDAAGNLVGFTKVTRDMSESRRSRLEAEAQAQMQTDMVELGLRALETRDLLDLQDHAAGLVADQLGAEDVRLMEATEDGFVLRAARGPLAAGMRFTNAEVPYGAALLQRREPHLVADWQNEKCTPIPGIRCSLAVTLLGRGKPQGFLAAHSTRPSAFTTADVQFVQSVANVLAAAGERAATEEQLWRERERTAQARAAVADRDEFISVAAHELRTPLTALQLKLQGVEMVLRRGSETDIRERVAPRLSGALRHTGRMVELVERLLDVSRVVGGRLELRPERFALESLLAQVFEDFEESARAAGCTLVRKAELAGEVRWDRGRIEQAVGSLLSNAIKYGAGKPVEVEVEAEPASGRVRIHFRDLGIGISPADAERIFGRFERAAPVRNYGGLGLGLYITRAIAEAHGGRVEVESHPNEGSRFTLDLPRELAPP